MVRSIFSPKLYGTLLGLISHGDAAEALRQWRAEILKNPPTSQTAIEMHQRWLASMLMHAEQMETSGKSDFRILFDSAQNFLNAHHAKVLQAEPASYSLKPDREAPAGAMPSRDVRALDEETATWSAEQWWDWLNDGFDEIENETPTAHLAFPPLRLYPLGNYVEQLAAALSEARDTDLTLLPRMLSAVQSYLQYGDTSDETLPGRNDARFWGLLGELGGCGPTLSIAHGYLNRLHAEGSVGSMTDSLCTAICDCVWRACAPPQVLLRFFDSLAANVDRPAAQGSYMLAAMEAVDDQDHHASEFKAAAMDALEVLTSSREPAALDRNAKIQTYVDTVLSTNLVTLPGLGHNVDFNGLVSALLPVTRRYREEGTGGTIEPPASVPAYVKALEGV